MNTSQTSSRATLVGEEARRRFAAIEGAPVFLCEWPRVLFVHYVVEADILMRHVPFELELFDGHAVVSVVAFTMRRFRPRWGGRLTEWFFWPARTNSFFNVRTYVQHGGELGAYFMTQWLSHPFCLFARLPALRLPWHLGRMDYRHVHERGKLTGCVIGGEGRRLSYSATIAAGASFVPPASGSLAEFAMERYTAFALRGGKPVVFRVWHEPWPQCSIDVKLQDDGLLAQPGNWIQHARFAGANYSIGCTEVWMGRVRRTDAGDVKNCNGVRGIRPRIASFPTL
jgi:uncharacterized protein